MSDIQKIKVEDPDSCRNCDFLIHSSEEGYDFCSLHKIKVAWENRAKEKCEKHIRSLREDPREPRNIHTRLKILIKAGYTFYYNPDKRIIECENEDEFVIASFKLTYCNMSRAIHSKELEILPNELIELERYFAKFLNNCAELKKN